MFPVISLTDNISRVKRIVETCYSKDLDIDPFRNILISPLFVTKSLLKYLRTESLERGWKVYFDSGGYYVQQGKITLDQLYQRYLEFVSNQENQWADWYVMPDSPPTSTDSPETAAIKVKMTISAARAFRRQLPEEIQEKLLPVIHGKTLGQLQASLTEFIPHYTYVGFGSFPTLASGTINTMRYMDVGTVRAVADYVTGSGASFHAFGITTPPAVFILSRLGFTSFDSIGWLKSAAYGKVYMPLVRAYNVSLRSIRNTALDTQTFRRLQDLTGHVCPFCEDIRTLRRNKETRALHNLLALHDSVVLAKQWPPSKILAITEEFSPQYLTRIEEVINKNGEGKPVHVAQVRKPR